MLFQDHVIRPPRLSQEALFIVSYIATVGTPWPRSLTLRAACAH